MFKKFISFLKYNNLTVFIVLVVFLLTSGVFAQTEAGQEFIGAKEIRTEGVDNTLLLEADLEKMDMDYKIEKIESDDKYYYVTYTYLDLIKKDNAWQYGIQENVRKVSQKAKVDLGKYLAQELREEYERRLSDLKKEQEKERAGGESIRTEVEEYTGVIGQALDVVGRVFTGYKAVKVRKVPAPNVPPTILAQREVKNGAEDIGSADNLTDVYEDYIASKDPDHEDVCDHEPESQKSNVESEEGTGTSTLDFLEGSTPEVNDEDPDQTLNSNDDGNTPPANADPSQEGNVEGGDADTSQVGSVDDGTSSEDSGFGAEETVITEEPDVVIFEIENQ